MTTFEYLLNILKTDEIPQDCNWDSLFSLAKNSGFAPYLFSIIKKKNIQHVPAETLLNFQNAYVANFSQTTYQKEFLISIFSELNKANLTAIPLKGTVLAETLYGYYALRHLSADLDILIKKDDFNKADALFTESGFTRGPNLGWEITYSKPGIPVTSIDLHWDYFSKTEVKVNLDNLWKNALDCDSYETKIKTMDQNDLVLYLALCITCGNWRRLSSFFELHKAITKFQNVINWDYIELTAKETRLQNALHLPFTQTQRLFQTEVPKKLMKNINASILCQTTCQKLFKESFLYENIQSGKKRVFIEIGIVSGGNPYKFIRRLFHKTYLDYLQYRHPKDNPPSLAGFIKHLFPLFKKLITSR